MFYLHLEGNKKQEKHFISLSINRAEKVEKDLHDPVWFPHSTSIARPGHFYSLISLLWHQPSQALEPYQIVINLLAV